jgi:hypothetical protein
MGWDIAGSINVMPPKNNLGSAYGLQRGHPLGAGLTTFTLAINVLYLIPIYIADWEEFTQAQIEVSTLQAASTIRLGAYTDVDGAPSALIYDAGTVSAAATGFKIATISKFMPQGYNWLCCVADTAGIIVRAINQTSTLPQLGHASATDTVYYNSLSVAFTAGALPSTVPATPALVNSAAPSLMIGV